MRKIGAMKNMSASAVVLPLAATVYQPPQPNAAQPLGVVLAFASSSAPSTVMRLAFVPVDPLVADDAAYRALDVFEIDAAGDPVGPSLYSGTTRTAVSGGSGDWTAGRAAFSFALAGELDAGHALMASWRPIGAGCAMPGGAWRVE